MDTRHGESPSLDPTTPDRRAAERDDTAPADLSLAQRVLSPRTLVSFGLALAVLALLATRADVDLTATLQAISRASLPYYLLALLSHYLVFPIRALRWRQMLLNSGWRTQELPPIGPLGEIIFLSNFVNCLVPAKLGDVYRAYLLRQRAQLSGYKAGGTIIAERVLDLAVLLVLGSAACLVAVWSRPGALVQALVGPLEILAGLVLLAAMGLFAMRRWSHLALRLLPRGVGAVYARFAEGATRSLGAYRLLVPLSVLGWLAESLRLLFVVRSLGLTLSPSPLVEASVVLAVAVVGSLLTAVPLTPAGLGFVESGVVAGLLLFGAADQSAALSIAFLDRTISYASLIAIGLVVYMLRSRHGFGLVR